MDADWNNSKIPRFVRDPVDRKKLFVNLELSDHLVVN